MSPGERHSGSADGRVYIAQSEFAVDNRENVCISTILGSCVACCLWDPIARTGGMNHVLLPEAEGRTLAARGQGLHMMELLVNAMVKKGALKSRMQAKMFGGASMIAGLSDAGLRNAQFVDDFLKQEGIACVGRSVGGRQARRVEFWPATGRARQKVVESGTVREPEVRKVAPAGNDVELF